MSFVYSGTALLDMGDSVSSPIIIDCDFHLPRFAAAYLVFSKGEAAFIDNNTNRCIPRLMDALRSSGLSPSAVKYVIITHVHLDHAGGTAQLMDECPNAVLLAHPKAARHMIDPARLIASVRKVYGDAVYQEIYGDFRAVDASRVRAVTDYETMNLGEHVLQFIHTRGHANHHMCIFDQTTKEIFTGDAFGQCYPDLQNGELFMFPAISPTDFNGQLAIEAIDKILATGAKRAYLTHFGQVDNITAAAAILKVDLCKAEEILAAAQRCATEAEIGQFCKLQVKAAFLEKLQNHQVPLTPQIEKLLSLDMGLTADGLACQAITRNSGALV
jgi:glyoxylase-like metal-dependent hydrolase (beta-lactamase superfamily II)